MGVEHSDDLRFAFRSGRLVFRALEDNEVDKKFAFELNNDAVSVAMGSPTLLRPAPTSEFERFKGLGKTMANLVIACLPPLLKEDAADGQPGVPGTAAARMAPRDVTTAQLLKETTPIGFVGLGGSNRDTAGLHRRETLAVSILAQYTGKGYGREMLDWMLDWGFRRLNLHRIQLTVLSYNENAIKLYRRMGFVEEGRSRETTFYDRKWWDTLHFGMLESEWEKLRGIRN